MTIPYARWSQGRYLTVKYYEFSNVITVVLTVWSISGFDASFSTTLPPQDMKLGRKVQQPK